MTFQGWYTQKDVIEDLMWATGKRVRNIDEHVLVGQEPPRPTEPTYDEDRELQLLRLNGGCRPLNPVQMRKPDLAGITKMLRMVDQSTDHTQEEPRIHATDKPSEQILSISKLNPEVREFIPKNNSTLDDKDSKPSKTDSRENNLSPNNRIDKTQLTADELKDMREKLKSKINTSNTVCVRVKRERNLAIATLLNLHCKTPKPPADVKPVLITPEYYEKLVDKTDKENVNNDCNNTSDSVGDIASDKHITDIASDKHIADIASDKHIADIASDKHIADIASDKHIAASVDKVQKWLSESEANTEIPSKEIDKGISGVKAAIGDGNQKVTPLYLGPVTFKRKAVTKPTSSTSSECERAKTLKSSVFVPSAYASELTKTYMERSKLKENIGNDLWNRVEMAIKTKESKKESAENTLKQSGELESEETMTNA